MWADLSESGFSGLKDFFGAGGSSAAWDFLRLLFLSESGFSGF
jgi:hypothetical protein